MSSSVSRRIVLVEPVSFFHSVNDRQGDHPIRDHIRPITVVVCMVIAANAIACSIPVFRYALENWQPDSYVAYVYHHGDLEVKHQGLIDELTPHGDDGSLIANVVVKTIDLDATQDEFALKLLKENPSDSFPYLVVQKPAKRDEPRTVFAAELSASNVHSLMDSPLRRTIRDRLIKGDSVVWVYLESGSKEKDDELFSMISTELVRLETELKLPEIEEEDLAELTAKPESLKIQLSAVRLSRDDAEEAVLRDMLLRVEPDLLDESYADQPMAFPVFGRGRALYALVGDGVAPNLIQEACQFLTGACQCTVKADNPGVDLLVSVNWDQFVQPTEAVDAALPPLAGFAGFGDGMESNGGDAGAIDLSPPGIEDDAMDEQLDADSTKGALQPPTVVNEEAGFTKNSKTSSSGGGVLENSLYVLLVAGCVVVVVTIFVTRRSGG